MTASIREQILAAFTTQLGDTDYTSLTVERNRDAPVTNFPMLVVIDGDMEASDSESNVAKYSMDVTAEGWVTADSGAAASSAANELYAQAVKAALADRTLSGLAVDITELSSNFQVDRSDGKKAVGMFSVSFRIDFFTKQGDPFTAAP